MDHPGPSGSGVPNAKRRKENDEPASDDDAIAVAPGQEQTADILKLDIDCFEEAFDYLPLIDLISVGKTCMRLQQVAGHCFSQNYSGKTVHISTEGVYINKNRIKYNVQHFAPFIQKIWINDENGLRYFVDAYTKFRRLKQIEFRNLKLSDMDRLKKISMGKLEKMFNFFCEWSNDFHEVIDQCVNLRYLDISFSEGESNWLNRKYPTLEYFTIFPWNKNESIDIPAFLELNPNIRKFETTAGFLWKHRDTMKTVNVKLDDLVIIGINEKSEFGPICNLLNDLHALSFYRKLELGISEKIDQEDIDRLASLNGLNKLRLFSRDTSSLTFSALNNLEELHMHNTVIIVDIDNLPNALNNLKHIHFHTAGFDLIMPFIGRSVEMHTIRVENLKAGVHFNRETRIIDLPALNRERALLTPEQLRLKRRTLYQE